MNRRGFLTGMLALGMAPAIVRASSLMPARVLEPDLIVTSWPPMFAGEAGMYEGLIVHADLRWAQAGMNANLAAWTRALQLEVARKPFLPSLIERGLIVPNDELVRP